MRAKFAVLTVLALILGAFAAVPATAADQPAPPFDYVAQEPLLSQPIHTPGQTFQVPVTAADGVQIYVEVTMPEGEGPFPVILESSVYHGTLHDRLGGRVFPDPVDENGNRIGLVGYFVPRGYAVAMMDLRGTGHSGGCLDHLGPNDAEDMRRAIEVLADAEWSNGRVGMIGHSYVGATQAVAAGADPDGLVTIVPSAGLASMYDHQFQFGVPFLLQYAGPIFAYETLAIQRHLPGIGTMPGTGGATGDDFGNNTQYTGCGLTNTATLAGTGQATGQYELWHAVRDHRKRATESDVSVFMVHGVNDNAARITASEWFFGERFMRDGDKVWLSQSDHGSGGNTRCGAATSSGHPTCRFDQWTTAVHAWFDHELMQRPGVETGPPVEVFLNDPDARETLQTGNVYTADGWARPTYTDLYIDTANGTLTFNRPTQDASQSFRLAQGSAILNAGGEGASFDLTVDQDMLLVGLPFLRLRASVTSSQVQHLVVEIERTDANGNAEPVAYCAIQPGLRDGIHTLSPVIPGQVMDLRPQCFTMAHELFAGDTLTMTVGAYSPHHVQASAEAQMTLFSGPGNPSGIKLPAQTDYFTFDDVLQFGDF